MALKGGLLAREVEKMTNSKAENELRTNLECHMRLAFYALNRLIRLSRAWLGVWTRRRAEWLA